jgi:exopolysaccharide biosynthesis polyprenyl glycosylphosphotransferase
VIFNHYQFMKRASGLFDLGVLVFSFVFAAMFGHVPAGGFNLSRLMALRITVSNCLLFAVLLAVWHNLFIVCGLYVSKRLTRRRTEVYEVCKATLLAAVLLLAAARMFHKNMVTLTFVAVFWCVCAGLMVSGRLAANKVLRFLRSRGRNARFLLIVGTNARAMDFARQISDRPELGYRIVGFVDDEWAGIQNVTRAGYKCRCDFDGLADFLRQNVVDEAAIYLPLRSYYEHAARLVSLCEQHGIMVRVDTEIFNLRTANNHIHDLDVDSQGQGADRSVEIWPAFAKRAMDIVFSVLLLIVLAPVFVGVAVLIKFLSRGPVFFRQTRVGLNKRQFKIYKFRTMIANAEQVQDQLLSMNEMKGPVFKIKNDPRVTPLGRILRKTSIDELPQLFNVLKGDMSLVGPRAMSMRDYNLFDQDWQRRRFSVKPGITCLWQVRGRNSVPFDKWMELDMQYIDKWSLWLDLKILAQTVPAVLRGNGAA